jgi:hypothetical protein
MLEKIAPRFSVRAAVAIAVTLVDLLLRGEDRTPDARGTAREEHHRRSNGLKQPMRSVKHAVDGPWATFPEKISKAMLEPQTGRAHANPDVAPSSYRL